MQFRVDAARAASAADARRAATLAKWWHTRSSLLWQDAAVLAAMGGSLLYAALSLRSARKRDPVASSAAPADAAVAADAAP